jgi:2-oxoglutarate dehydrogenase E2 component (dihydrolipoamide succinyltransferase)
MPVIQAVPVSNKQVDVTSTMPPSVQKLVTENNLNPTNITGTGKDGRINKGDVLNVLNNTVAPLNSTGLPQINSNEKPVERVRMSRLRKTIAQRLKDSQNTAAILSTFNEIDMSKVIALRTRYKDSFQEKHGMKLGFMSFFVKAVINALKEVPSVNAEMEGDDIIYKHYYDIGVAVGTEQGLVVPVVRNADRMNFSEIEKGIVSLAVKARDGKLSMSDLTGGTFSITNGGVYGSLLSTPIINPPQTGIIGLHNTQERPVAINGKVEIRPMMYIALSYDHRVIDGKDAVTFLVKVKQAIEDPERLLLDL